MFKFISLFLISSLAFADLNVCPKMPVAAATSHNWISAITAGGATTLSQPAFSDISGSVAGSQMPALTGDITTSAGAVATTLATVNSNIGSFTNASITVNGKGLITAASSGSAGSFTGPTVQSFSSGSGTYTKPTSPAPLYIKVEMVGGGGGGGGSANSSSTNNTSGGAGGNSTFGTSLLTAGGGTGGGNIGGGGGAGGTNTVTGGTVVKNFPGGQGQGASYSNTATDGIAGGMGGNSIFWGAGSGGAFGQVGNAGATNTGGGGGGAGGGDLTSNYTGTGGGAGGGLEIIITSPSATYAYSVGASGSAGPAGNTGAQSNVGGAGSAGKIIVTEYYQ